MEDRIEYKLPTGDSYTVLKDKEQIKRNLKKFNDVCNEIFADKEKYKDLFYSDEELQELHNNPQKCKELNIEFI